MTIKPVLRPDHTATDLRELMNHFAEATTGPTRQELTESRAAVAAAPGVAEGVNYTDELRDKMQWLMTTYHMRSGEAEEAAYYDQDPATWKGSPWEDEYTGVSEARPDVMRHKGDTTVRVVKKGGVPIGEIGTDSEASPGNGPYYVKLYDGSYDAVGFDTAEEALAELRYAIKSAGSGPDTSFGGPGGWTGPVGETSAAEDMSEAAPQLQPRQTVWAKNTRGYWIEYEVSRVRPDGRVAVMGPGGIDIFPAELLVTQRPTGAVAESIDPIAQLRADILRFSR